MSDQNGRNVTVRELNDKLNGLRWEMRAYALAVALTAILKLHLPDVAVGMIGRFF